MKPLPSIAVICICLLATANVSFTEPEHDALVRYKAFRAAVQGGKAVEALKLIESVPKDAEPLLAAALGALIVQTALHAELAAQMGPPDPEDEDYLGEFIRAPEVLKTLKVQVRHDDLVLLWAKDPQTNDELTLAPMIRRDGKWLVPAALLTGMELEFKPGAQSELPPVEERQQLIEYTEATTKVIEAVLKRVKNNEFKTRAEVVKAIADAMPKADGEIDIDER